MSDYIKREDAIEAFDPKQRRDWYTPWIVETLKDLPSADVVPVVRCKDCMYSETDENGFYYCIHDIIGGYGVTFDADTFCSYGERKDDEGVNA